MNLSTVPIFGSWARRLWLVRGRIGGIASARAEHPRDLQLEDAVTQLGPARHDALPEAVDALRRNLACGTPSVKVRAATATLDQGVKAVELVDVVERVEHLEARLAAAQEAER